MISQSKLRLMFYRLVLDFVEDWYRENNPARTRRTVKFREQLTLAEQEDE